MRRAPLAGPDLEWLRGYLHDRRWESNDAKVQERAILGLLRRIGDPGFDGSWRTATHDGYCSVGNDAATRAALRDAMDAGIDLDGLRLREGDVEVRAVGFAWRRPKQAQSGAWEQWSLRCAVDAVRDLRVALDVVALVRAERWPSLAEFNRDQNPGHWERLARWDRSFAAVGRRQAAAVRVWFSRVLRSLGVELSAGERYSGPYRYSDGPRTVLQLLWLACAVAAGAVAPPDGVEGLTSCSYGPCRVGVVVGQKRVRGSRRFCSDRCRRSFHAAESTKRRRADGRAVALRED